MIDGSRKSNNLYENVLCDVKIFEFFDVIQPIGVGKKCLIRSKMGFLGEIFSGSYTEILTKVVIDLATRGQKN